MEPNGTSANVGAVKSRFRLMVLIMAGLWLMSLAIDLFVVGPSLFVPAPGSSALTITVWYGIVVLQLVAFLGAIVGLYLFRRWGRLLALIGVTYATLMSGFVTGYEGAGLAAIPDTASAYLLGAILGLAYLAPPISEAFGRRNGRREQ